MRSIFIGLVTILVAATFAQDQKSIASLLNLSGSQLVQLEQLYDYVHAVRYQEEMKKDRDLTQSTHHIRAAFDSAQREAKTLLSPGQVYLLENRLNAVKTAPWPQHRLPLVGSLEEFMEAPVDIDAAQRWLAARDLARREQRTRSFFGFGYCGRHHWCSPNRPRCGNGGTVAPPNGSRRLTPPRSTGSTGSRGGSSVVGSTGGKR